MLDKSIDELPPNASEWESLIGEDDWTTRSTEALAERGIWEAGRYYVAGDVTDGIRQAITDSESGAHNYTTPLHLIDRFLHGLIHGLAHTNRSLCAHNVHVPKVD